MSDIKHMPKYKKTNQASSGPARQDRSPRVSQREKFKGNLTIRDLDWTEKQLEMINAGLDNKNQLVFCDGLWGTGKTACAVYTCLQLLKAKKIDEIIYLRNPIESSASKIGYLKGDLDQKFEMYVEPLKEKLEEFLPPSEVNLLIQDGRIMGLPIGFIRGRSWNCKGVIVDEASCLTREELLLVISRIGRFSKCFVVGDQFQSDIGNKSGFRPLMDFFSDQESKDNGIVTFELKDQNDIMRSDLLRFIMKKLKATTEDSPEKVYEKIDRRSMFEN